MICNTFTTRTWTCPVSWSFVSWSFNGWDQRHHPLKASIEQVAKLNRNTIYMYFASHSRAPCKRHGLGQQLTNDQLMECLIRENLVANTPYPSHERFLSSNLLPGLVFPCDNVTRFLFIVTPDCMLITLKFQDELVQPAKRIMSSSFVLFMVK